MLQKIALIDDEAPARKLLREYLTNYTNLVIIGEAPNGVDALRLIEEHKPEIIFLDVQMPGLTGLEVLARLEELPLVIFSTAYDQYALEAFDFHAVDYLLKPYTQKRFDEAIRKLLTRLGQPQDGVGQLAQKLRDEAASNKFPDRIMVPKGNRYLALPVNDIQFVRAEGDYSSLVTADTRFLSQFGLGEMEKRLPPDIFIRIHRSTIINRGNIKEVYREGHGYDLVMDNGEIVRVSRSHADKVKELLF
ncbi:MAG: LytTR family DNA-binding domain-containing protein [Bacteroidota bacterium]